MNALSLRSISAASPGDRVSEPAGADIYVDGGKVLGATPAVVEVKRDHRQHTIEVRKAGYLPAMHELRYDREVRLQVRFQLVAERRPPRP